MSAMAAAGSGRIGAACVVPEPPAKTRPAIPTANNMRNICVHPILVDPLVIESLEGATDQLKNGGSCSKSLNGADVPNLSGEYANTARRKLFRWRRLYCVAPHSVMAGLVPGHPRLLSSP
jgi:hypothetical protein